MKASGLTKWTTFGDLSCVLITDHFSSPYIAIGLVFVCLCVSEITFERNSKVKVYYVKVYYVKVHGDITKNVPIRLRM